MMKKLFTVSLLVLFVAASLMAEGQKYLLRINGNGDQEAIAMRKGESTANAIARAEKGFSMSKATGLVDTLSVYDKSGVSTNTAFSFGHMEVGLQWYLPEAGGLVREFWFQMAAGYTVGIAHKAQVRAWYVDPRMATLPKTSFSEAGTGVAGNMGYYKMVTDGDGLKTPFRDEATDTAFVKGKGDANTTFDPLGKEVSTWLIGGAPMDLTIGAWHKLVIADWGDSIPFKQGVPFGFTLQNLTTLAMVPGAGIDTTMTAGAQSSLGYPYHSVKFYEGTATSNYGWQIRAHEWRYYVVVEYTTDRAPKATLQQLFTTLKTTARTVTAKVTDDNPGGGAKGVASVDLYAKVNSGAFAKSSMTGTEPNYTGTLPAASPGDTVTYYIVAKDVNANSTTTGSFSYTIFAPKYSVLCIWNGRTLPTGLTAKTVAPYYMMKDSLGEKTYFDVWDVKSYGKADVPDLLKLYNNLVVEVAGDGGQADLTAYAEAWLATATPTNRKMYIMSDQDHGFISGYADTTFDDANVHAKYFGVKTLGPQDYPNGATYPWKLTPQDSTDNLVGFIQKFANKTGTTYWYDPNFELAPFTNWMDQLTPTSDATTKAIFKDGTKVTGVRKDAADNSWHTMYLAFDYLATDFRSDTTKHPASGVPTDPKYAWILDAGSIVKNALKIVTAVGPANGTTPIEFNLSQNYPNPFNPSTQIEYAIPQNSFVTLKVFNAIGQEIASLVNSEMNAGRYSVTFDASRLSSGMYFYTLTAGSLTQTHKMVLMK